MDIEEIEGDLREVLGEEEENERIWSRRWSKLLISTRLKLEKSFKEGKKKRSVLWNDVLRKIKAVDSRFPFTTDDMIRKFNNFKTTYKRTKQRAGRSGAAKVNWEYYSEFDCVYGSKHSIQPPKDLLMTSMETVDIEEDANPHSPESLVTADELNSTTHTTNNSEADEPPRKKQKQSQKDEILTFIRKWSENEEKRYHEQDKKEDARFKEVIQIEKEKNEIEKQKIQAILALQDTLNQVLR